MKTTSVLCIYNVFTIISMVGMIGFTSYGEMIFHTNFLASGGNSVQTLCPKLCQSRKMPLKLISCLKCLKLPAGLFRSSMETGKSRKNVYLLKYCYH